jgi:hypothetical protein
MDLKAETTGEDEKASILITYDKRHTMARAETLMN